MGNQYQIVWTEEKDAVLRAGAGGKRSYGDMARELGVTRSAVSGRMYRLGLQAPTGPRGEKRLTPEEKMLRERLRRERYNALRAARRREQPSAEVTRICGDRPVRVPLYYQRLAVADVVPLHLALLDLGANQCRYPYGDDAITFCGCPALDGLSYCEPHQRLTHSSKTMTIEEFTAHKRAFRKKMIAEAA